MTRERAQRAVDDAFAAHVGKIFSTLVSNIVGKEADAAGAFSRGLAAADEAHSIATGVVERVFAE